MLVGSRLSSRCAPGGDGRVRGRQDGDRSIQEPAGLVDVPLRAFDPSKLVRCAANSSQDLSEVRRCGSEFLGLRLRRGPLPTGRCAFRLGLPPVRLAPPVARGRLVLATGRTATALGDRRSRDFAPSARSRCPSVLREFPKVLGAEIDHQPTCAIRDGDLLCGDTTVAIVADDSDCFQPNLLPWSPKPYPMRDGVHRSTTPSTRNGSRFVRGREKQMTGSSNIACLVSG
jgi:hypothetical protein